MARRTKEDADETRNRLLDAAEQVFYDKGVSRASLAEIALAAGMTRGAIYWHFKDKVDLFSAMMERVTLPLEMAHGMPGTRVGQGDPLQHMHAMLTGLLRDIENDARTRRVFEIAMYRVEYVGEALGVRERRQLAYERFAAVLVQYLDAAADAAQMRLPMDTAVAAAGLQALFDGLLQAWILGGGGFDLQATGHAVIGAYLRGLGLGVVAG